MTRGVREWLSVNVVSESVAMTRFKLIHDHESSTDQEFVVLAGSARLPKSLNRSRQRASEHPESPSTTRPSTTLHRFGYPTTTDIIKPGPLSFLSMVHTCSAQRSNHGLNSTIRRR